MAHTHAKPAEVIDLGTFGENKSAALVKEKEFQVIRLVVDGGKSIPQHQVAGPITVQCLSGKCTFLVGQAPRELAPGSWLYLTGGTAHAIEGSEESCTLLVTMLLPKGE